jgi:REP element-mobilizing transposase RayT
MSRKLQFALDEYYHVYNRGVEKRVIFNNEFDYQRFLLLLVLVNDEKPVEVQQLVRDYTIPELIRQKRKPLVSIASFSLMPNHYHLLMKETTEKGISKFMHKVGTGYSLYFNLQNERTGGLFQGPYKAKHVDDDRYLQYLFEYIHLNPIRESLELGHLSGDKAINEIVENPHTSLRVYAGKEQGRLAEAVLNRAAFNTLFDSYAAHVTKLKQWSISDFEGGLASLKGV